jgi:hypothetical protein
VCPADERGVYDDVDAGGADRAEMAAARAAESEELRPIK